MTKALDSICFMFNSIAMGDVIASVPVVKYMVDTYFPDHNNYVVVAKQQFRVLFPFVPDKNFLDFDKKDNNWGIPENYAIAVLNKKNEYRVTKLTPKHMNLGEYAGLIFADRILPKKNLEYVPIAPVDVSKFGVDFHNSVILVTTYRDVTRSWYAENILKVAEFVKSKGLIPVFVGKTDMDQHIARDSVKPKTALPDGVSAYGVDLRNKTSIAELASIFSQARAVCGVDSGPIHLAGTTNVPIVCGYTSVSSCNRIPIRSHGISIPIEADIPCIGCESRWHSSYWNFEQCHMGTLACVEQLTADKFIAALNKLI